MFNTCYCKNGIKHGGAVIFNYKGTTGLMDHHLRRIINFKDKCSFFHFLEIISTHLHEKVIISFN